MRIYLAATLADLTQLSDGVELLASAVTPALHAALPEEDTEGLEMSAYLTAADLSVLRIAELAGAPRRVVVSVEATQDRLAELPSDLPAALRALPSLIGMLRVELGDVVAVHLDPDEAAPLVLAAAGGDDEAFDDLAEEDLLWYDPSELRDLLP